MDEVASAEASVERFREEFDKLQRALKKSITTEKILVTKVSPRPCPARVPRWQHQQWQRQREKLISRSPHSLLL